MLILHKFKRKIGNWCLNHLFNSVTEDDIFIVKGKNVYLKGVQIEQQVIKDISSQARIITELELYKLLLDELKYNANVKIYKKSVTQDDLLFSKAMLHTVEIIENKLEAMKKF